MLSRRKAKQLSDNLLLNGVKIKCCYCTAKEGCSRRQSKEKSEDLGFTTYCTLTPNRPKSYNKNKQFK